MSGFVAIRVKYNAGLEGYRGAVWCGKKNLKAQRNAENGRGGLGEKHLTAKLAMGRKGREEASGFLNFALAPADAVRGC